MSLSNSAKDFLQKNNIFNEVEKCLEQAKQVNSVEQKKQIHQKVVSLIKSKQELETSFRYQKLPAKELFRDIIVNLKETGHPWLTFKDNTNNRNQIANSGVIHNSNLCTEIVLPNSQDEIAVCILGYINLMAHFKDQKLDFDSLSSSVKTLVRHLDNIVDINFYPIKEAENGSKKTRALGIGMMGLSDYFSALDLEYDSNEARYKWEEAIYRITYAAYESSAELALERGSYPGFEGSNWSKGILPIDTYNPKILSEYENSGKNFVPNPLELETLREKVKKGMRNGVLTAIAPTEHGSRLAGVSAQIEPIYSNIYTHKGGQGKVLNINKHFVKKLKNEGVWDTFKEEVIEVFGDVQALDFLSEDVKKIYKNAFQIPVKAQIEIAALGQKHMDQSLSRNLYHSGSSLEEYMSEYMYAWKRGLKTTYYAVFKPNTENLNKYSFQTAEAGVDKNVKKIETKNSESDAFSTTEMTEQEKILCSLENKDECEACQ